MANRGIRDLVDIDRAYAGKYGPRLKRIRRGSNPLIVGVALLAIGASTLSAFAGPASRGSDSTVVAKGWDLRLGSPDPRPKDRWVRVEVETSVCPGNQQEPRFQRVDVVHNETSVEITVYIRRFPVDPGVDPCDEVLLTLSKRVKLHRRLGNRVLLDGSKEPPKQVWP